MELGRADSEVPCRVWFQSFHTLIPSIIGDSPYYYCRSGIGCGHSWRYTDRYLERGNGRMENGEWNTVKHLRLGDVEIVIYSKVSLFGR